MPIINVDFSAYDVSTSPIPAYPSTDPWSSGTWGLATSGGRTSLQTSTPGFVNKLLRPIGEGRLNTRTRFVIDHGSDPGLWHMAAHRVQPDGKAYFLGIWGSFLQVGYTTDSVNFVNLDIQNLSPAPDFTHPIEVTCDTEQDGTDVLLNVSWLDLINGATATLPTVTDPNRSGFQAPGRHGLFTKDQGGGGIFSIRRYSVFDLDAVNAGQEPAVSFNLGTASFSASATTIQTVVATGVNTNWAADTLFTMTGADAVLLGVAIASPTSATFTFIPGRTAGTVTIADAFGVSDTFEVTGTATGLMYGLLTLVEATEDSVEWSATDARGGTAPYAYSVQRDIDPNFTAPTTVGTALTGTDTGPFTAGEKYYYRIRYTDAAPATVTGLARIRTGFGSTPNQMLPVVIPHPMALLMGIGDSITEGTTVGVRSWLVRALYHLARGARQWTALNRGIPGTQTSGWLTGGANLNAAIAAGDALSIPDKWAAVMLGVNDITFSNRSVVDYLANVEDIAGGLVAAGYRVLLVPPLFALSIAAGANYAAKLQGYGEGLPDLADNIDIFAADMKTFDELVMHPTGFLDTVHTNDDGEDRIGEVVGGYIGAVYDAVDAVAPTGGVPLIGGGLVR